MYFQNYCVFNDKYGKNKNNCSACGQKHYPPTGKNCKNAQKGDEATTSAALASSVDERYSFPECTMSSKKGVKGSKNAVAREDSHVKRAQYSSVESNSDHEEALEKRVSSDVQGQILKELKRMSSRLNTVEEQVVTGTSTYDSNHDARRSRRSKISSVVRHSKCNARTENTDSSLSENSNSDDELKLPKLSYIRSSKQIQKQIDQSLAKLGKKADGGNDSQKLKSKRGGGVL